MEFQLSSARASSLVIACAADGFAPAGPTSLAELFADGVKTHRESPGHFVKSIVID
jgi:hypothetical protein